MSWFKLKKCRFLLFAVLLFSEGYSQNRTIDSLLNVLPTISEDTIKIKVYNLLSKEYRRTSDLANSLKYANTALKLSDAKDYSQGKIIAFNNLGIVHFILGKNPEALKYFFSSVSLAKDLKRIKDVAAAYNNISDIYEEQQNYSEASKYLNAALNEFPAYEDIEGTIITLANLGAVYTLLKNYADAKKTFDKALQISNHVKDPYVLGILNGNIGFFYQEQNDYLKAVEYNRKALEFFKSIHQNESIATAFSKIGYNLVKLADVQKSKVIKDKLYKAALDTLNTALPIAKSIGSKEVLKDLYESLASLDKSFNNFPEAFNYLKLSSEMKDSVFNDESSRKLQQLKTQFEVEQAIKEEKVNNEKLALIQKTKHEQELADEKLKEQQIAAEEEARHERVEYQENLQHEKELAEQRFQQQQLILHQKLFDAKTLAEETTKLQKIENEEKLRHERALYEVQIKHQKTVAEQKRKQDLALAEKEKRNNRMLEGSAVLFISGLFTILYTRQRQQKRRAIEKADALHRMAELELQSLRAQLNPHFMFNSLNSIQELIMKDDTTNSHIYLSRFSKLLRMLLENASQPFIQLQKEIDFLHLYLSLEKLRIPDLEYTFNIDPELEPSRLMTPNMMLQPYIENAIWHGLSHKKKDRKLLVNMKKTAKGILFEIIDNGVGREKAGEMRSIYRKEHQSKGMELLSRRFDLLSKQYGTKIETTIIDLVENNEPAGTEVDISVPVSLIEIKSTNDTISVN
jgi:tetratricopeptide (TPR) repeat protein